MSPDEMMRLAGAEFNRILSADPVLKELEAAKYDEGAEFLALLAVLQISGIGIGAARSARRTRICFSTFLLSRICAAWRLRSMRYRARRPDTLRRRD